MAVKRKVSAAPMKQRLRKNHGPKRRLWHDYGKVGRINMGQMGMLTKYHDKESFALSLAARGVKSDINELWNEYCILKTNREKDSFLVSAKEHAEKIAERKSKKFLPKAKK